MIAAHAHHVLVQKYQLPCSVMQPALRFTLVMQPTLNLYPSAHHISQPKILPQKGTNTSVPSRVSHHSQKAEMHERIIYYAVMLVTSPG